LDYFPKIIYNEELVDAVISNYAPKSYTTYTNTSHGFQKDNYQTKNQNTLRGGAISSKTQYEQVFENTLF
jgi:hypothetical protein